jgi:CheY-like chemotaxis protein/HPt (histidine-containing phosphotransfer) domain-containing protein
VATVAGDGAQAVTQCANQGFDLILMDLQMPVMDGLSAARELRARGIRTPIVAMTANAFAEDKAECLSAGMDDFLTKPVDPGLLQRMLARYLGAVDTTGSVMHVVRTEAAQEITLSANVRGSEAIVDAGAGTDSGQLGGAASSPTLGPRARAVAGLRGFDTALGLKTAGGKPLLYERVLGMFLEQNRTIVTRFDAALAAGDADLAIRIAHTLKGTGNSLGAVALGSAALAVEQALKSLPRETGQPLPLTEPLREAMADAVTKILAALAASELVP